MHISNYSNGDCIVIDYSLILSINYPNSQWALDGDLYDGLTWYSETPKPTQAELDALWDETKKKVDFIKNRQQAYPSIVDQLDTLYHGGFDAWKATIEAVKNQYPKP